jgi:hypothetical protein
MAPKGPLRTVRKRLSDANWTLFFRSLLVAARQALIHIYLGHSGSMLF